MMIARVFPRKLKPTPVDDLAFFDVPGLFSPVVDEVHISVLFTWDIQQAEWLAREWGGVAPVKIGGPAFGTPSGEFVPGRYVQPGYTITSRGCPNNCWFCSVWKREPKLKELQIHSGYNLLDDNILACSDGHIKKVFDMLEAGKTVWKKPIEFTGGLEAKILKKWHVKRLMEIKTKQMFFAYDTPDDYEHLVRASELLKNEGFNRGQMRCYVLIGWPKDNMIDAERRLIQTLRLGFFPMAMLYRNPKTRFATKEWRQFQRGWARPACIAMKEKELTMVQK